MELMVSDSKPDHRIKHRSIAILIAFFFGPWTWLYTFSRDSWKLAIGLGVTTNLFIFGIWDTIYLDRSIDKYMQQYYSGGVIDFEPSIFISILFFTLLLVWGWALIDRIVKHPRLLNTISIRYQRIVIILSTLLTGPWTWLCTYDKDKWKFWVTLTTIYLITGAIAIVVDLTNVSSATLGIVFAVLIVLVWSLAILDTAIKIRYSLSHKSFHQLLAMAVNYFITRRASSVRILITSCSGICFSWAMRRQSSYSGETLKIAPENRFTLTLTRPKLESISTISR